MSLGTHAATDPDGAQILLSNARFELMPFESFNEEITHLPDGATIAITTSPQLGIDTTVEKAEQATASGYEVVPHIAARYVEDRDHLDEIATRLDDAGITDVFVPGGDREEPAGEFGSAYQLLVALDEMGHEFEEVGITGYPEGHYFLDDETLAESMANKEPYATYITTQLCYDPDAVIEWIEDVRDRGVELPIEVGIPGVMKYQRLLQISKKVGVGESMKFLQKTTGILGFVRQLIGSRGKYKPDALIDGLAPCVGDDQYDIRGIHVYTMNQSEDLESWRRERLDG
jgi:methylenetetrahydrofolate reductase (NADPH)